MDVRRDGDYYLREYVRRERSTYDIASEHGTYANKIRRELIDLGFFLRDKSEAQVAALKHGRQRLPTRGRERPADVRRLTSGPQGRSGNSGSENNDAQDEDHTPAAE